MEMAKTNGWAVVCTSTQSTSTSVPIYSKYTRYTELRRVDDNDIYKLASILDMNGCWQKLMSIIPKHLNAEECSGPGAINFKEIATKVGYKYTDHQIKLIAAEHLNPGQSISQIMIDEWKTSGKFNERPTVGVLLQLLIQAEIYSAADHVALNFLNEPHPVRPADGPAAVINFDLSMEQSEHMDVDETASFQPNTSELNAGPAQVRGTHMNVDYYDKHMVRRDKSMPQQLENGTSKPVPPPRVRPRRTTTTTTTTSPAPPTTSTSPNIPMLSILNGSSEVPQNIPNLSILNGSSESFSTETTTSATLDAAGAKGGSYGATMPNVPLITLLIENPSCEISNTSDATDTATTSNKTAPATDMSDMSAISYNNLPAMSALNLNTGSNGIESSENGTVLHDDNSSGTNSLSNDDDDDEDEDVDVDVDDEEADVSLPNLSNSEHQTSNNDSSLTTVTGTSGENSFELTNDSSSASNDDYASNIPNLSELQQ